MNNLGKYRQLSYLALTGSVVFLLLTFAALWNSLLTGDVKHEGWVIVFLLLLSASGALLFFIAYRTSDSAELEKIRKEAMEAGKNEILQELEKRNQIENQDEKLEDENLNQSVDGIFSGMQGIRSETGFCNKVLANLAQQMGFVQGILYIRKANSDSFIASGEYALTGQKPEPFRSGETLAGTVAESKSVMVISDIPEQYVDITSGLGSSKPRFLVIAPVLHKDQCVAVLELAAFKKPDDAMTRVLNKLSAELGNRLHKFLAA